jgi:hypothetical protein
MKHVNKLLLFMFILGTLISQMSFGQVKFGLDAYSHYVWRGVDFSAQSLQPSITYTTGGLSVGAWASYSTTNSYSENDLWASYAVGPVTVYLTDYYIPSLATKGFFDYGEYGSHTLEGGLGITLPGNYPLTIAGYVNFRGEVNALGEKANSTYIQASYPFTVDSVTSLSVFAGATTSDSYYYGTSKASFINVGLTFSKTIKVTESFSLPVNASYIINPSLEKTYLVFGVSF